MALRGNLNYYAERSTDDSHDCFDSDMLDEEILKERLMRYSHTGKVPSMNTRKTSRYIQSPVDNMFKEPADINEEDITRQVKNTTIADSLRSIFEVVNRLQHEQQEQQEFNQQMQQEMERSKKAEQELKEKIKQMEHEKKQQAARDAKRAAAEEKEAKAKREKEAKAKREKEAKAKLEKEIKAKQEKEAKAKLEKFLEEGSKLLQGDSVEVSKMIDLVEKYTPELKKADEESLKKFDTSKQHFDCTWKNFKRSCDESVRSLETQLYLVVKRKKDHEETTIKLSTIGATASTMTLVSMWFPPAWALAVVGAAGSACSAIGSGVQHLNSVQWQTAVVAIVVEKEKLLRENINILSVNIGEIAQCFFELLQKIEAKMSKQNKVSKTVGQGSTTGSSTYQVDKRVGHVVNQFVKAGSSVPAGIFFCDNMASKESVNAATKMQRESMKAVKNGTNAVKVVKVVGTGLALYSLVADIYEIYNTQNGKEGKHELYTAIQRLIEEIKIEKSRTPCILLKE